MDGIVLSIVLASALLHACWNYLTKKSLRKTAFLWWTLLVASFLFFPMLLFYWPESGIDSRGCICILASSFAHAFYFRFLGGAYERGDLSLVYPLSRGFGPLLIPILAVTLMHERLTPLGIFGIAAIVCGIYVIHLRSFSLYSLFEPFLALRGGASLWAILTGSAIASYSLVDKVGVTTVHPPVYIYLMLVGTFLLLTPFVLVGQRATLMREWTANRNSILIVGFLSNFTYLMILFAMRMSKVSYVSAVREVSIVFSALFGILWLDEAHARIKLAGALLIALGVVLIGASH